MVSNGRLYQTARLLGLTVVMALIWAHPVTAIQGMQRLHQMTSGRKRAGSSIEFAISCGPMRLLKTLTINWTALITCNSRVYALRDPLHQLD